MNHLEEKMSIAIEEANIPLREGNCRFGALIVLDGNGISKEHDTEKTANDFTAHAKLYAIKMAREVKLEC